MSDAQTPQERSSGDFGADRTAAALTDELRDAAKHMHSWGYRAGDPSRFRDGPVLLAAAADEIDRLREIHRQEQRRSADRLRECLESK